MEIIKEGDYILISTAGRRYFTKVEVGKSFSTKTGSIKLAELIGKPFGIFYNSHFVFKPNLEDIILHGIKRGTQIVYPKESFFIGLKLGIKNGMKVFECGTGSGALTLIFSQLVGENGIVYTYEISEKFLKQAKKNFERFGIYNNVKFFLKDISEGIDEKDFDSAFLDVREPKNFIKLVYDILKPSASLGIIVPTTNQISETLPVLKEYFSDIEVLEILQRYYKVVPERIRPEDRMVAHTGFLIFGRKFITEF
jgi:tRNA (adenine57-N1/adenine58-N1)-methyltransferase